MKDEKSLISQLQEGDKRALSAIYDNYSAALYGVILRMCKEEAVAKDILQETFIKIWKKADSFDATKGKFYTWAYRIARNTTLNALRSNSDLIQNADLSVYSNKGEDSETEIDTLALNGCFKKLDPHHQQALKLVYFDGLTHREAHKVMQVPLGTFKSYVQQALRRLREEYPMQVIVGWILMGML